MRFVRMERDLSNFSVQTFACVLNEIGADHAECRRKGTNRRKIILSIPVYIYIYIYIVLGHF